MSGVDLLRSGTQHSTWVPKLGQGFVMSLGTECEFVREGAVLVWGGGRGTDRYHVPL